MGATRGLSVLGVALLCLTASCKSQGDSATSDAGPVAPQNAVKFEFEAGGSPPRDAAVGAAASLRTTAVASNDISGPRATCGLVAVWAVPSSDGTDIVGRPFDAQGAWKGEARLLRHTSGAVSQLVCAANATELWVAWFSSTKTQSFVALVRSSGDVSLVSPPATLVLRKPGELLAEPDAPAALMIAAGEPQGATIAYPSGRGVCRGAEGASEACPEFSVATVDNTLTVRVIGKRAMPVGPNIQFDALVNVKGGVAVSAFGWHGGAVVENVFFRSANEPADELPSCRPPHRMANLNDRLVIFCPGDFVKKGERCPLAHDDLCPRIAIIAPDAQTHRLQGKLNPLTSIESRCTPKREREYKWDGGSVIVPSALPKFYLPNTETKLVETPCDVD